MPAKKSKAPVRARRGALGALLVLILLSLTLLLGLINAKTLRVVYLDLPISGLDPRLEGSRLLYVSDLKISNARQARQNARLLSRLCSAQPDVMLLGGDLCSADLFSTLSVTLGVKTRLQLEEQLQAARSAFLLEMNRLSLRGGIYAVLGDEDPGLSFEDERRSNIRFLKNEVAFAQIRGARLPIYGCAANAAQEGYVFSFSDTGSGPMLILFHDPKMYRQVALAASRRSKNAREYLLLSGHTLGGQLRLGKFFLLHRDLNRLYTQHADENGLYADDTGLRMLVSPGVGSQLFPFRLGTRPSAYIITLKAG